MQWLVINADGPSGGISILLKYEKFSKGSSTGIVQRPSKTFSPAIQPINIGEKFQIALAFRLGNG